MGRGENKKCGSSSVPGNGIPNPEYPDPKYIYIIIIYFNLLKVRVFF